MPSGTLSSPSLISNSRGEESATQWSVVYNLDDLTATIATGMDYENTYTVSLLE